MRILAAALLLAASLPAQAQDLSPFVGRWQINLPRSYMGRFGPKGPNMVRAATFTFVFKPARQGLSMETWSEYPQPAPSRVTPLIADGRPRRCQEKGGCLTTGGNAAEQSFSYVMISPRFLVRRFYVRGKVTEYTSYALSDDGTRFTMIAWSAETPYWQNIQAFDRQP